MARHDAAVSDLARKRQLAERGLLSKADLQVADTEAATLASDITALQAQLQQAEANLGRARISAPFDGIVATRAVEPGQTIALVGKSGSGKSSLVSLIPRFYEHNDGEILLDNIPVQDYKLKNLRHHISLVAQQVVLFNGTVAENIAYGEADVPRSAIEDAARNAHALEFIEQLEQGLDTQVGDDASLLSGGQRQRIAIARALLKNAPILIFDEATSALDSESEMHIQDALQKLIKGRTTFVIAHRLSTIENADQILVMEQGRIIEAGTHAQLIDQNGHYSKLHRIQFSESSANTDT